jgi:putative membrane protein insertion efficiency factor
MLKILNFLIKKLITGLIKVYQFSVSPLLGNCCRFSPSCSNYCLIAIEKYGVVKGITKGLLRLSKCHPFHPGGVDLP